MNCIIERKSSIFGTTIYLKELGRAPSSETLWIITIMLNYIRENIDNAQEQAKQKISLTINKNGYKLVTDVHDTVGIETRIFQWINTQNNHCIQLIWDGKEDWFDLGEFQYTDDMNYLNATQILLVPIRRAKLFNRKNYVRNKIDKLIEALNRNNTHNIN